jgi:hypothetical protein
MVRTGGQLTGSALEITLTAANSAAQAWYGYDQGVISGILIGSDFIKTFPQTKVSSIQGITASCFSVSGRCLHQHRLQLIVNIAGKSRGLLAGSHCR